MAMPNRFAEQPQVYRLVEKRRLTGSVPFCTGGRYGCGRLLDRQLSVSTCWLQRLHKAQVLRGHGGCVNTVSWNDSGTALISGSDDRLVKVWHYTTADVDDNSNTATAAAVAAVGGVFREAASIETGHSRNIFCALFVPGSNEQQVVSCGLDGQVRLSHVDPFQPQLPPLFAPVSGDVSGMAYRVAFLPEQPKVFLSCHEDGHVRRFDLRAPTPSVLFTLHSLSGERCAVSSLCFDPLLDHAFVTGCGDPFVRLWDLRMTAAEDKQHHSETPRCVQMYTAKGVLQRRGGRRGSSSTCVTDVAISSRHEIAASYSGEPIYLWNVAPHKNQLDDDPAYELSGPAAGACARYTSILGGHRNQQTFLKQVAFIGSYGDYVASGSDGGHFFVWDRDTGKAVQVQDADVSVVNCVVPHPTLPIMATSGIDSDIKIWGASDRVTFDEDVAFDVMEKNYRRYDGSPPPVCAALLYEQRTGTLPPEAETGLIPGYPTDYRTQLRFAAVAASENVVGAEPSFPPRDDWRLDGPVPWQARSRWPESVREPLIEKDLVLKVAEDKRQRGNHQFREQSYRSALTSYRDALRWVKMAEPAAAVGPAVSALGNVAACFVMLQRWQEAETAATAVLDLDRNNAKALYRRALARTHRHALEEADEDLAKAAQLAPSDTAVQRLRREVQQKLVAHRQRQRNAFKAMFES